MAAGLRNMTPFHMTLPPFSRYMRTACTTTTSPVRLYSSTRSYQRVRAMAAAVRYPIGTPGVAWTDAEKLHWRNTREIQRSYADEVVAKLEPLKSKFDVTRYGSLSHGSYEMFAVRTLATWSDDKPCVLVTGGVHGYETSGVQGAIAFLATKAEQYASKFNIVVLPCVSPWGYETIQRWNASAVDPNRSFNPNGEVVPGRSFNPEPATEESTAVIAVLKSLGVARWLCHIDLHETTDTDESEFRPAKAARDGVESEPDLIPDGFYLVADNSNPQTAWVKAIIDGVRTVTHIAPPDANGKIIGEEVIQEGVIGIPPPNQLGLCAGVTNASYATTTEVYPDSPSATPEQCNAAQVAAVCAALDHLIAHEPLCK